MDGVGCRMCFSGTNSMFIAGSLQILSGCIHIYSTCTTPTCSPLARGGVCTWRDLEMETFVFTEYDWWQQGAEASGCSQYIFSPRQKWSKRKLSKPSGLLRAWSLKFHNMIQNVPREYISCCHSIFVWWFGMLTRGTSVDSWRPARLPCGSSLCFTEYKIFNSRRV